MRLKVRIKEIEFPLSEQPQIIVSTKDMDAAITLISNQGKWNTFELVSEQGSNKTEPEPSQGLDTSQSVSPKPKLSTSTSSDRIVAGQATMYASKCIHDRELFYECALCNEILSSSSKPTSSAKNPNMLRLIKDNWASRGYNFHCVHDHPLDRSCALCNEASERLQNLK